MRFLGAQVLSLVPGPGQERSKAGSHAEGRNAAAHPPNPSLLAPPAPPPCSPVTVSPPNKDFIFYSDVQRQRLPLKFSPSIINESGVGWGKQVADNTKVGDSSAPSKQVITQQLQSVRVCVCPHCLFLQCYSRCLRASFTLERTGPWGMTFSRVCSLLEGKRKSHSMATLCCQVC